MGDLKSALDPPHPSPAAALEIVLWDKPMADGGRVYVDLYFVIWEKPVDWLAVPVGMAV